MLKFKKKIRFLVSDHPMYSIWTRLAPGLRVSAIFLISCTGVISGDLSLGDYLCNQTVLAARQLYVNAPKNAVET